MNTHVTLSGAPTDPAGPTGRLCTWLADRRLEDVPSRVQERAKALTLDGLACAIVGAQLPWSRLAVELTLALEGRGDHALIDWAAPPARPRRRC